MSHLRYWPAVLLLLSCGFVWAQQPGQDEMIRVRTDLVVVDAKILNSKTGILITGLQPKDIEVYEDGVRQAISHFSQDRLPISIGLLLDVSTSMQEVIERLRREAMRTLQHLKPEDEVAVIAYGDCAQLIQDFTKDRRRVVEGISSINESYVGSRSTNLSEAVFQVASHMKHATNPASRRVIIAVGDDLSGDFFRAHTKDQALNQLFESAAAFYGVKVQDRVTEAMLNDPMAILPPRTTFKYFSDPTGGDVFGASITDIAGTLANLFDGIRACYSIGYVPSNGNMNGEFRRIQIRFSPSYISERTDKKSIPALITKTGYYAGSRPDSIVKRAIPEKRELPAVRDWFYGAGKQKQMFRSLFALKEARDFQTLMVPNILMSPQGETAAVLSFVIGPKGIRLKQINGRHIAKFRLLLAIFNETGMIVAYWNQDYPLSLDKPQYEQFQGSGIRLGATIHLRPGQYQVRSVIREWNSKKMSAESFPLDTVQK